MTAFPSTDKPQLFSEDLTTVFLVLAARHFELVQRLLDVGPELGKFELIHLEAHSHLNLIELAPLQPWRTAVDYFDQLPVIVDSLAHHLQERKKDERGFHEVGQLGEVQG